MRILGISGSLRPNSKTHQALQIVLQKFIDQGLQVQLLDVRDLKLPFCSGEAAYPDYPDVLQLQTSVKQAHGIVLASPEYHGTISGVLKNALDLLDRTHLEDKVVGLISILGGAHTASSLDTLRVICRQLHAWTIPEQVIIANSDHAFNGDGQLIDPEMPQRLNRFVNQLKETVRRFHS